MSVSIKPFKPASFTVEKIERKIGGVCSMLKSSTIVKNCVKNEIGHHLKQLSEVCFSVTLDHSFGIDDPCLRFGNDVPGPVDSLENLRFSDSFKRVLFHCLNIKKPLSIQRHLWPLVGAGFSVCCVSGQRSGKTSSYLIPILERIKNGNERTSNGPLVLIICSCHKIASAVLQEIIKFRGNKKYPQVSVIQSFVDFNGRQTEIVIATPLPLLRLIENNRISLGKCLFFVLDDGDKALELYLEPIKQIYSHYISSSQTRFSGEFSNTPNRKPLILKTLIFAEKWTENVEKFKNTQYRPVVLFGSFFESLIASKVKCAIELTDSEKNRTETLRKLVDSRLAANVDSIAVLCCTAIEAFEVIRCFSQTNIHAIRIDEKTHVFDTRVTQRGIILVVIDAHIPLMKSINDVQCLIHYNLPATKTVFSTRFSLARQRLQIEETANQIAPCESYIILSSSNKIQVHQLYNFLKRCKMNIPVEVELLRRSVPRPLCKHYLSLGYCQLKKYFCFNRHSFNSDEKAILSLPITGQLKGFITSVLSPNEVYMQINEYRNENSFKWKRVNRMISREAFQIELNRLQMKKSRYLANVVADEVHAVLVNGNIHRVKVLSTSKEGFRLKINLFHIDFGSYSTCSTKELIPLPEALKYVQPFVNQVHVWGIKPVDNEIEWNEKCTQRFVEIVNNKAVECVTAWVLLQINGIFWVEEMRALSKLNHITEQLITTKISQTLLDERFAERNMQQLPNFNFTRDYTLLKWKCEIQQSIIKKAFLDDDTKEVYLSCFYSVDEVYLQIANLSDCLKRLEKDLNDSNSRREKVPHFFKNSVCLCAKGGESKYKRAQIQSVNADDTVTVKFVDYGDVMVMNKENCYLIEDKYITTLPFQAIRCKLSGITGSVNRNLVYNYTRVESTPKSVLAKKMTLENGIYITRLYVEVEPTLNCRKFYSLSKWLVENGHAKYSNEVESKVESILSLENEIAKEEESNEEQKIISHQINNFYDFLFAQANKVKEKKMNVEERGKEGEKKVETRAQRLHRTIKKYAKKNERQPEKEETESSSELPDVSNLPDTAFDFSYANSEQITTILPFDAADVESSNESEDSFHENDSSSDC